MIFSIRLTTVLLLHSFFCVPIFSQINTESLRHSQINDGWGFQAAVGADIQSGNSISEKWTSWIRADYLTQEFQTFVVGNYEYGEGNNRIFSHKGFLHGRFVATLSDSSLWTEIFVQKEFNQFILIKDRNLLGATLRLHCFNYQKNNNENIFADIYIGSGIMYEHERINTLMETTTQIPRSTTYLTLSIGIPQKTELSTTIYAQSDVRRPQDYRILCIPRFSVSIFKQLSFTSYLEYRYDSEPPVDSGLRNFDLSIKNALMLRF